MPTTRRDDDEQPRADDPQSGSDDDVYSQRTDTGDLASEDDVYSQMDAEEGYRTDAVHDKTGRVRDRLETDQQGNAAEGPGRQRRRGGPAGWGENAHHLEPHGDGWSLRRQGEEEPYAVYEHRRDAMVQANRIAVYNHAPVVVHGPDGEVVDELQPEEGAT